MIYTQTYLADAFIQMSDQQHAVAIADGIDHFSLRPNTYQRPQHPLMQWVTNNTTLECTWYDHEIPPTDVVPLRLYEGDLPWNAITLTFDPHSVRHPSILTDPELIAACYKEKQERYLMKSIRYTDVEVGWLCYNHTNGVYLVHHNQIRGTVRDRMSNNDLLWLHRYLIRSFRTMVPPGSVIIAPDADTLVQYINTQHHLLRIPTLPFSRHVLGKSGFTRISGVELARTYPTLHQKLVLSSLPDTQQTFWLTTT